MITRALFLTATSLMVAALLALRSLSPEFAIDRPPDVQPVAMVAMFVAVAGIAFAVMLAIARRLSVGPAVLAALIALGFAMRLLFFGSQPILEDDWRRYLWEGAAVAAGVSPFDHAPADGLLFNAFGDPAGPSPDKSVMTLRKLGAAHDDYPELVNHPFLTTIYPPPVQAAFAVAHVIAPFSLDAWRLVLLAAESLSLFLLLRALPVFGLSAHWSLIYWLNPIVIVQTFSGAHMDALIVPPLVATLFSVRLAKPGLAGAALGLAAGIKVWPLLLAPMLLRRFERQPRALALAIGVLACVAILCLAPLLANAPASNSGLAAYVGEWRRNAFVFDMIEALASAVMDDGATIARMAIAAFCAGAALWLARRPDPEAAALPSRALCLVMIVLLVSPTAYPWYVIWAAAFLPFVPSLGAGLLAAGGAIYLLRFPNELTGGEPPFLLLGLQIAIPAAIHFAAGAGHRAAV